jgi:glycerol 3-phosphatase-2
MKWTSSSFLLETYDAFILDAFGVFWSGAYVLEPAKSFMHQVVKAGKPLVILSNATQMAAEEKAKYEAFGLIQGIHYHLLLTSGEISRQLALMEQKPFEKGWTTYYAAWPQHPKFGSPYKDIFKETRYEQVEHPSKAHFIYLNTPYFEGSDQTDPDFFERELDQLAHYRLPIICPNPDEFAQQGHPAQFVVRQGILAQRLEKRGMEVRYIGKPEKLAFDKACESIHRLQTGISSIVMIGDNPKTDIQGAKEAGLSSALLVETGVLAHLYPQATIDKILGSLKVRETPDHILKALTSA